MNIFCVFTVGMAISWKFCQKEGIDVWAFFFFRNFTNFLGAFAIMHFKGLSLRKDFPTDLKVAMGIRAVMGTVCFFTFVLSL